MNRDTINQAAKRVAVIGASSGIGLAVAKRLTAEGCRMALAARRVDLLEEIRKSLPGENFAARMDIAKPVEAAGILQNMIEALGGLDEIYICAGVDHFSRRIEWDKTRDIIDINVSGFAALANAAYEYFARRGGGAIVGISSFAALRGNAMHPAYSASKAFVSNYMEGLRLKSAKEKLNIQIVDVRPGFVDTPMSRDQPGQFWVSSADSAAAQIIRDARRGRRIVYLSRRWGLLAHVMRHLPHSVMAKL